MTALLGGDEEKAKAQLDGIFANGGKAWSASTEASDRTALECLLAPVLTNSGRVDIVIDRDGGNSATPHLEISEDEFDLIMRIKGSGVFLGH